MIKAGKQLGKFIIGSKLDEFDDIEPMKMSLEQKLYRFKDFNVRVDKNGLINWISTSSNIVGNYEGISVGSTLKSLLSNHTLLYDDFEFLFYFKGCNGLAISFNDKAIDELSIGSKLTTIIVYSENMDLKEVKDKLLEISNENLSSVFGGMHN